LKKRKRKRTNKKKNINKKKKKKKKNTPKIKLEKQGKPVFYLKNNCEKVICSCLFGF
jgi:hypothetical protein